MLTRIAKIATNSTQNLWYLHRRQRELLGRGVSTGIYMDIFRLNFVFVFYSARNGQQNEILSSISDPTMREFGSSLGAFRNGNLISNS